MTRVMGIVCVDGIIRGRESVGAATTVCCVQCYLGSCNAAMHVPCGILSSSKTSASDSFVLMNATLSKADLGSKCLTTAHMLRPVHPTLTTYTASMRPGKLLCPTESSVGSRSTSYKQVIVSIDNAPNVNDT